MLMEIVARLLLCGLVRLALNTEAMPCRSSPLHRNAFSLCLGCIWNLVELSSLMNTERRVPGLFPRICLQRLHCVSFEFSGRTFFLLLPLRICEFATLSHESSAVPANPPSPVPTSLYSRAISLSHSIPSLSRLNVASHTASRKRGKAGVPRNRKKREGRESLERESVGVALLRQICETPSFFSSLAFQNEAYTFLERRRRLLTLLS